jgi:putative flippase GtrA
MIGRPGLSALLRECSSFALIGCLCFLVDAFCTKGLIVAGLDPYASRGAGFLCAVTASWCLNRTFTFRSRRFAHPGAELAGFILANLPGAAINYGTYAVLIAGGFAGPIAGVAAGSIAGMTCNFTLSRFLVFRPPSQSKSCAAKTSVSGVAVQDRIV